MKQCSKCHTEKAESEFYTDKRTPDGLKCQCKKCHYQTTISTRDLNKKRDSNKEYMRRAVAKNPEKFRAMWSKRPKSDKEKTDARRILNAAVKSRKIIKPAVCSECGIEKRVSAHHEDYAKPLEVTWLCYECHGKRHRRYA